MIPEEVRMLQWKAQCSDSVKSWTDAKLKLTFQILKSFKCLPLTFQMHTCTSYWTICLEYCHMKHSISQQMDITEFYTDKLAVYSRACKYLSSPKNSSYEYMGFYFFYLRQLRRGFSNYSNILTMKMFIASSFLNIKPPPFMPDRIAYNGLHFFLNF